MTEYVRVGEIVNTHGIKGEVRVIAQTDFPFERFAPGQHLYLLKEDGSLKAEFIVFSHRQHKQFDLILFEGFDNINQVLDFVGYDLFVKEDQLGSLDENSFYIHDLIGLEVRDDQGRPLGSLKEVLTAAANDVWVVQRPGQDDLLLPVIQEVIQKVNLEEGCIQVKLLEGMDGYED